MVINIYTNANNLKKFYLGKLVQQKCGNFEVDDSNGFTKIIWPEKQVTIMIFSNIAQILQNCCSNLFLRRRVRVE